MKIVFDKYQGTGNDFILLDQYHQPAVELDTKQIRHLCDRHFGIGADGLMYLRQKAGYDFEMVYFNADGNESSMCGNGGRCIVKFARKAGIVKTTYRFWATDGEHEADIETDGTVRLRMKDVNQVENHGGYAILNTGSPHYVLFSNDVAKINVVQKAQSIRYNEQFLQEGINVNFVESTDEDSLFVRTYERGVEDETLSCGTGVTAAALVSAHNDKGFNRVEVRTPGGHLSVEFEKQNDSEFSNIWLCGPAEQVFSGEIEI